MTREQMINDILGKVTRSMSADIDVREATPEIVRGMATLLSECDVEIPEDGRTDTYTAELVEAYVGFVAAGDADMGGSHADYCASNALTAISGYRLRLRETPGADEILHEMRVEFHRSALNPRRMFGRMSRAGIPIGRKKFLA